MPYNYCIAPELLLSVSPVELSVEEGTSVRFVCTSNIPGISLRWFQRDRDLPPSATQTVRVEFTYCNFELVTFYFIE